MAAETKEERAMASKDKLKRFKENESFKCLIQPHTEEVLGKDHPLKGHWASEVFGNSNPIVLELGCGKGEYTIALSRRDPSRNYIGIDIKGARLWRGAKTATEEQLPNVAFLRTHIEFITSLFAPGEVSEIWITFADPQLLRERKRLVNPIFCSRYRSIMAPDGVINLKTDSRFLHEYAFAFAERNGLEVLCKNVDVYAGFDGDPIVTSVQTFYESYYLKRGKKITFLKFKPVKEGDYVSPNDNPEVQEYLRGLEQIEVDTPPIAFSGPNCG